MEINKKEIIDKINNLSGKELSNYIDKLLKEDNPAIVKDKDILLTIASRLKGYSYTNRVVSDKLKDIGIDMDNELKKIDKEKTLAFLENNNKLMETINIAIEWWISVIKKPYYMNFNLKSANIDMQNYFVLNSLEQKIEDANNEALTEEKEKIFREVLTYEIADEIRNTGKCKLLADNFCCFILNQALDAANLKVVFPKKCNMLIKEDEIYLADSKGNLVCVYDNKEKEENKTM